MKNIRMDFQCKTAVWFQECWYSVLDTYVQTTRLYYHCKTVLTLSMSPEVSAFFFFNFVVYIFCDAIHSIGMCRMRRFLAVLRIFFLSFLLCTFSCHPSPPTILPSSFTSSCHLFFGLPLNLVPKFIYNTLL